MAYEDIYKGLTEEQKEQYNQKEKSKKDRLGEVL